MGTQAWTGAVDRIAICIATRNRPKQLQRLLDSLDLMEIDNDRFIVETIVVDNSRAGGLAHAGPSWLSGRRWATVVLHEPRHGIPFARNAAIAHSIDRVTWLAFVDDDETVDRSWLERLLSTAVVADAAGAAGPVRPLFEVPPPKWFRHAYSFKVRSHPTGTLVREAGTNNLVLRSQVLSKADHWFDERLALTGGSDTELTRRLTDLGHRIVWCEESVAYESVPPERIRLHWLLRRWFREGNNRLLRLRAQRGPVPLFSVAYAVAGIGEIALGTMMMIFGVFRGSAGAVRGLRRTAKGAGAIAGALGYRFEEYRQP